MPLYMYQAAYTSESWAAQLKNPQNRIETVGRQACEAVGGAPSTCSAAVSRIHMTGQDALAFKS